MWDSKLSSGLHTEAMPPCAYWLLLSGRRSLVTSTTRPARAHSRAQVRPAMPLPSTRKSLSTGTVPELPVPVRPGQAPDIRAERNGLTSRKASRIVEGDAAGGLGGGECDGSRPRRAGERRHLSLPRSVGHARVHQCARRAGRPPHAGAAAGVPHAGADVARGAARRARQAPPARGPHLL